MAFAEFSSASAKKYRARLQTHLWFNGVCPPVDTRWSDFYLQWPFSLMLRGRLGNNLYTLSRKRGKRSTSISQDLSTLTYILGD